MRLTHLASFVPVPLALAATLQLAPLAAAQDARPASHTVAASARPVSQADVAIRRSAQAYWNRRQVKDLAGMYEFYSAGYRARVPRAAFLQQTRLVRFDLTDATISRVEVSGERATVTIAYRLRLPALSIEPVSGSNSETWIREGRMWRKLDEPLEVPFPRTMPDGTAIVHAQGAPAPEDER